MPVGTIGNFLAAGPTPTQPSIVTFSTPIPYISFLWGSPETFDTLTVMSIGGGGVQVFTNADFGLPDNGDPAFAAYVQFQGIAGSLITSLEFTSTQNAFETSNYSITPVPAPEPGTIMLVALGIGLAGLGFSRRQRKQ